VVRRDEKLRGGTQDTHRILTYRVFRGEKIIKVTDLEVGRCKQKRHKLVC